MADDVDEHPPHPTRRSYLEIGLILAIMTALEVLLYVFREDLGRAVTTPGLILLTIGKFVLVGAWFMHLRFDHPALRRMFVAGILLAAGVFAIVTADWFLGANPDLGF
jgi:cytochrome c oxidase subunit IV